MRAITERRIIDFVINATAAAILFLGGAGWWILILIPLSVWNFYDGATRCDLEEYK